MDKQELHILMVEDNALDAELNMEQLKLLEEYSCKINVVSSKEQYLNALETTSPDIVLCDYNLPDFNGLQALHELNERVRILPFIFVTGAMQEEIAADAIKSGAWDYVVKDRLFRLPLAIKGVLKVRDEKRQAALANEKINNLVMAVDQTSAQIILLDNQMRIVYINNKVTEITGYALEDVLGKPNTILDSPDTTLITDTILSEILNQGLVYNSEAYSIKKDGTYYWELISITPIKNNENEFSNYVVVKEDISLQKEMEQDLIKARDIAEQSNRLKEAFLHNLSHEIRTPLNAIVGFSDLLRSDGIESPEIIEPYTNIIKNSSNQLLSIVSDILTTASILTGGESLNITMVDIHSLFDEMHSIFSPQAKEKNLELRVKKPFKTDSFPVKTDVTKLTQILTNLLNNAIKYTFEGFVELKYEIHEGSIDYIVSDSGIGIEEKNLEIIFERFCQASTGIHTNFGGTGLGLSISKSFAEMMGGAITVSSEPEKGSVFRLSLPFTVESVQQKEPAKKSLQNLKAGIKILIAEDEVNNFQLLESILKRAGAEITHAVNGQEAVDLYSRRKDFDAILMDLRMPIMDGITAFREIKNINPQVPIIAQSAYVTDQDIKTCLDMGFSGYLTKPISYNLLFKEISDAVK